MILEVGIKRKGEQDMRTEGGKKKNRRVAVLILRGFANKSKLDVLCLTNQAGNKLS